MKDLEIVKSILKEHYNLGSNTTYIFGSRVSGCHRPDSDLDILIDDKDISPELLVLMEERFEESSLTYKVDIVLKSRIDDSFYSKIKSDLKELF